MTDKRPLKSSSAQKTKRRVKQPAFSLDSSVRVTLPPLRPPRPPWPHDVIVEIMRQQTCLFLDLIDGLTDCIFFKDGGSVYVDCNWAFARLVGLKYPHNIRGKIDEETQ